MVITIHDDFNLQRIIDSGQCFRPVKISDGRYRFITGKHLLHIQELGDGRYEVDCSRWNWKHTWKPYFDLNVSYAAIRRSIPDSDTYLTWAAEYSQGIRILRQDPWEMLITFIISQRKSIPAIRSAVEMLCEKAGTLCEEGGENFYTFPRPGGAGSSVRGGPPGMLSGVQGSLHLSDREKSAPGKDKSLPVEHPG